MCSSTFCTSATTPQNCLKGCHRDSPRMGYFKCPATGAMVSATAQGHPGDGRTDHPPCELSIGAQYSELSANSASAYFLSSLNLLSSLAPSLSPLLSAPCEYACCVTFQEASWSSFVFFWMSSGSAASEL